MLWLRLRFQELKSFVVLATPTEEIKKIVKRRGISDYFEEIRDDEYRY
jgi:hypothetical protein